MSGSVPHPSATPTRHYFVDEHGDGVLFDSKGRVIAGELGCSSHFALGVLDVRDPAGLSHRLTELRQAIVRDPYFHGVESLKPERQKTAISFHAKDDLPEIRHMVFKALAAEDVAFQAVIREKRGLAVDVHNRNRQSASYHYHPNRLYDEMVKRLFKNLLHKDASYRICFASRGHRDRTQALRQAIESARDNFRRQWNITSNAPIEVCCLACEQSCPLQAADYFLWALQRAYTKAEDRYLRLLWPKVSLVHDVDDRRKAPYGVYYNQQKPLTVECLKKAPGI